MYTDRSKNLKVLLTQQVVDDECLTTVMCEVESIMNSRPLTKVSDDPKDLAALTPNHLLLLRPGPSLPPGPLVGPTCIADGDGDKHSIYPTYFGEDG